MTHSPDTAKIKHVSLPRSLTNGLGNAHDDAEETIRGRIDHDRAHGVRPVKTPQKVGVEQ